jgi:hypothetical protein
VFEYDANLNLTWLRNWNVNGPMNWATALNWAATLTVGAFSGWALPTIDTGDTSCSANFNFGGLYPNQYFGFNCTGSAMGYLYYTELGNPAGGPLSNTGPFQNLQSDTYWSATEFAPSPDLAWIFLNNTGTQSWGDKSQAFYAVAVRPGDVAAAVPEPQTLALVLLALGAGVVTRRRRPASAIVDAVTRPA